MACRGVLFALTDSDLSELLAMEGEERVEHISNVIEERDLGGPWAVETDKAWDAIQRCFGNGELAWEGGDYPLSHIILGGVSLYDGDDYVISHKTPEHVRAIAATIGSVTEADVRARYRQIDPDRYGMDLSEEDEGYTWEWFSGLIEFYMRAAEAGRHVLFTVDQ